MLLKNLKFNLFSFTMCRQIRRNLHTMVESNPFQSLRGQLLRRLSGRYRAVTLENEQQDTGGCVSAMELEIKSKLKSHNRIYDQIILSSDNRHLKSLENRLIIREYH